MVSRRRRSLPNVSPQLDAQLRPIVAAMKEIIETGEGVRGDPMDQKITYRDLLDSGIGKLRAGARPGGNGSLEPGFDQPAPNLAKPPVPTGFAASGGFNGRIDLTWDIPKKQYSNHGFTLIYRSETDNLANASEIGQENGSFYTDVVRDDAEPKTYYYWIRFVSVEDVEGPPNDTAGTPAQALEDVGYIIEQVTGEIGRSVLAQDLQNEIGAIETELRGPESLDGTVAARVATEREARILALQGESDTRAQEILDEQQARVTAISNEADARAQAVQAEVDARVADVSAERDLRVAAIQQEQGDRATAISTEQQERIDADGALSSEIQSLTSVVDVNSADIVSEQTARADSDSALASDISALQVKTGDNEAAIFNESSVRASETGLIGLQLNAISASYQSNSATMSSLEEVRINDREVTASRIDTIEVAVGSNEAAIYTEQTARSDAVSSLASQVSVLSAKIDALPTYANGFEAGAEFALWSADTNHTIVADNSDPFAGSQAAIVESSESSVSTTAPPFAVSTLIPSGTSDAFSSRRLRLSVSARQPDSSPAAEFGIGYATSDGWFSGWTMFQPGVSWETVEAYVELPESSGLDHYFVIWGDTSGSGLSTMIDRALIDVANSELPEITAQITAEQEARADADEALSLDITALNSRVGDAESAITSEQVARSTADTSMASDISTLQTSVGDNAAAITNEQQARTNAVSALASDITVLQTSVGDNEAAITSEQTSRASADSAMASDISTLQTNVGDNAAAITSEQEARADDVSALSASINTLTAATDGNAADILSEQTARTTADESMAEDITALYASVDDAEAEILEESKVRATEDELMAGVQKVIAASKGASSASFYGYKEVRVTEHTALAERVDGVEVSIDTAFAAIEEEQRVRSDGINSLAIDIETLTAEANKKAETFFQGNAPIDPPDGAFWIDTDNNNQLRVWDENDNTWRDGWDKRIESALAEAATAQETADGKIKSYWQGEAPVQPTSPAPAGTVFINFGDLWFDTDDQNHPYRWDGTQWEDARDSKIAEAVGAASDAQSTADGKVTTFYDGEPPTAEGEGDLWVNTAEDNQLHQWDGTNWINIRDGGIAVGMGRNQVFRETEPPTAENIGDLWFDSDDGDKVYEWDGEAWAPINLTTDEKLQGTITENNRTMVGYCVLNGDITSDETPDACAVSGGDWVPSQALAESVKKVGIVDGEDSITLEQKFVAQGNAIDGLSGKYTVKIDSNGGMAGFGLASTPNDDTADGDFTEFYVNVDRFALLPQGETDFSKAVSPFFVQDGKTWIDTAMIREAAIEEGQLGAITFGKIEDSEGNPVTTVGGKLKAGLIETDNLEIAETATFYGTLDITGGGGQFKLTNTGLNLFDSNGVNRIKIAVE